LTATDRYDAPLGVKFSGWSARGAFGPLRRVWAALAIVELIGRD
jgi:hypothetical protein